MPLALIAAIAGKKQVIGNAGDLPWHFSSDLKFFKEKTSGHAVLMGRVTYQSILRQLGKPLPGRQSIVLTRDLLFSDARATVVNSLEAALAAAPSGQTLFVIGGEELFRQTLPMADTLFITHIEKDYEGDAFFPPINPAIWKLVSENKVTEKDTDLYFRTYARADK